MSGLDQVLRDAIAEAEHKLETWYEGLDRPRPTIISYATQSIHHPESDWWTHTITVTYDPVGLP